MRLVPLTIYAFADVIFDDDFWVEKRHSRVLRLAYLAPDIVEAIVVGRQPQDLSANRLVRRLDLPTDWASQRDYLGFPVA